MRNLSQTNKLIRNWPKNSKMLLPVDPLEIGISLPKALIKRVAVEEGGQFGWERYDGFGGKIIGIVHCGATAPGERILKEFRFMVENVVTTYNSL